MSAADWRQATHVHTYLGLAAQLWHCAICRNDSHHKNGNWQCPYCRGSPKPKVLTPRKQRLIACAACRFLGEELTGEPALHAVEVAELFADGQASPTELLAAHYAATAPAARAAALPHSWDAAMGAVDAVLSRMAYLRAADLNVELTAELTRVLINAEETYGHLGKEAVKGVRKRREPRIRAHFAELRDRASSADGRAMAVIIRDVLGDPFDPVRLDPSWLEAGGGQVRQVAQAIYDSGQFDEMPILADALLDAGCNERRLLDHCLEDRHYRGCWLLDAILCKT